MRNTPLSLGLGCGRCEGCAGAGRRGQPPSPISPKLPLAEGSLLTSAGSGGGQGREARKQLVPPLPTSGVIWQCQSIEAWNSEDRNGGPLCAEVQPGSHPADPQKPVSTEIPPTYGAQPLSAYPQPPATACLKKPNKTSFASPSPRLHFWFALAQGYRISPALSHPHPHLSRGLALFGK